MAVAGAARGNLRVRVRAVIARPMQVRPAARRPRCSRARAEIGSMDLDGEPVVQFDKLLPLPAPTISAHTTSVKSGARSRKIALACTGRPPSPPLHAPRAEEVRLRSRRRGENATMGARMHELFPPHHQPTTSSRSRWWRRRWPAARTAPALQRFIGNPTRPSKPGDHAAIPRRGPWRRASRRRRVERR